jgi:hypothetical protein
MLIVCSLFELIKGSKWMFMEKKNLQMYLQITKPLLAICLPRINVTEQLDIVTTSIHVCFVMSTSSKSILPKATTIVSELSHTRSPLTWCVAWTNKDDYHMLRQSFYSKDATPARQEAILRDHGVRFSILNVISGWLPSRKSALDFMHCIFLGMCLFLYSDMPTS